MKKNDVPAGGFLSEAGICMRLAVYDLLFLLRHGFFAAYAVILLAYIGFFTILPQSMVREGAVIFAVYSDTAIVGFYFSAAMVFLERDQNLIQYWNILPATPLHYTVGKIISFGIASVVVSLILYIPYFGLRSLGLFSVGVLLSVILYIPLALILSLKLSSLLDFLLISAAVLLPSLLPLTAFLGILPFNIALISPGYGVLMLLSAGMSEPLITYNPLHLVLPLGSSALFIFLRSRMRGEM